MKWWCQKQIKKRTISRSDWLHASSLRSCSRAKAGRRETGWRKFKKGWEEEFDFSRSPCMRLMLTKEALDPTQKWIGQTSGGGGGGPDGGEGGQCSPPRGLHTSRGGQGSFYNVFWSVLIQTEPNFTVSMSCNHWLSNMKYWIPKREFKNQEFSIHHPSIRFSSFWVSRWPGCRRMCSPRTPSISPPSVFTR